jgi:hypothetical protein
MQRGFIAQEVEKVLPEWVGVDKAGFKTINMTGIEPMLVESIRELKTENDALKARIEALEVGRRPALSMFGGNGMLGLGMIAVAGAVVVSRRKRQEDRS